MMLDNIKLTDEQARWLQGIGRIVDMGVEQVASILLGSYIDQCIERKEQLREQARERAQEQAERDYRRDVLREE